MARARTQLGGGRHDLRERGVFAMVGGSEHHSLYAYQGQHSPKEQPVLRSRAFYVSARTQPLHLSRRPATQLWWSSLSESRLQLHWNPQTLWCVRAKNAVPQRPFPVSQHPPARSSPATRTGVSGYARVCPCAAPEKEGGSAVRRTEESDRVASLAPAEIEVCARAVLPGGGCPEHQAPGAVPQPTDSTL